MNIVKFVKLLICSASTSVKARTTRANNPVRDGMHDPYSLHQCSIHPPGGYSGIKTMWHPLRNQCDFGCTNHRLVIKGRYCV